MTIEQFDYEKAEETIKNSLQNMHKKQLEKGMSIHSERAATYYGKKNAPTLEDPVEAILLEEQLNQQNIQPQEKRDEEEYDELSQVIDTIPYIESIASAPKRKGISLQYEDQEIGIQKPTSVSTLLQLRKHILWFKMKGFQDRYERIGTTLEEIMILRKKTTLSQQELKRIEFLNAKAVQFRNKVLENESIGSDEGLIDYQKKEHRNRFHSVRERWLRL